MEPLLQRSTIRAAAQEVAASTTNHEMDPPFQKSTKLGHPPPPSQDQFAKYLKSLLGPSVVTTPLVANLGRIFIGDPTKPLACGAESVRFALAAVQACEVPQIKSSYLIDTVSLTS
jgi:hypothetical protein